MDQIGERLLLFGGKPSACLAQKASPTVWTEVPGGEVVTVALLTRSLERLLLTSGTVVASDTSNSCCRNTLIIDVPDRERLFRAVKGVQNHYVVGLGDHAQSLSEMTGARGIDVVCMDEA